MRLFSTERTDVYLLTEDFAEEFQQYLVANKDYLAPFEPLRDKQYFILNNISERIKKSVSEFHEGKNLLIVFTIKEEREIIGSINFTNFVYGVFQACYLGFSIDHAHQGKGLMHEVLNMAIEYVHEKYELHRVMANHLPDNLRSRKTLESLGFIKEGYAKSYLKINGVWQDHVLNSLILPEK
ncbi:GNAT family N-acetyltransferase [[Enterobacter] lignolyticus]|uniref:GCN5 family acetyltransferase n=1 Tax=[Enterobacter] lignolyticus TaxID=1334193 RepID=A0A806XC17_9ENTR|nr:GNAT family N-acetyltransferase [[Enterobacter] lignolyticus]ALR76507.1 GCN5 family acetyltransferase [[Enterobacter] lignolyticus]